MENTTQATVERRTRRVFRNRNDRHISRAYIYFADRPARFQTSRPWQSVVLTDSLKSDEL